MDVTTPENFNKSYPQNVRERFWGMVGRSLSDVFGESPHRADSLRKRIEDADITEQMHFYHQEPIRVAADLVGISEISQEQLEVYRDLVGSPELRTRWVPDYRAPKH